MGCLLTQLLGNALAQGSGHVRPEASPANPPYIVQVRHFSVDQGLPNRSVNGIEQDAQGFMWIGTINNAYRFDGSRFLPLPDHSRPSRGQLPAYVDKMRSDQDGSLWFFKARSDMDQWAERWVPKEQKLVSFTVHTPSAPRSHLYPTDLIGQRGQASTPAKPLVLFQQSGRVYRYTKAAALIPIYTSPAPILLNTVSSTATGNLLLMISDTTKNHHSLVELDSTGKVCRQQVLPKLMRPVCTDAQGSIYLVQLVESTAKPGTLPHLGKHQLTDFLYKLAPDRKLTTLPIEFSHSPFVESAEQGETPYSRIDNRVVYDAYHDLFWFMGRSVLFAWHPTRGIVFDLFASGAAPANNPMIFSGLNVDRTGGVWVGSSNGFLLLTLTPNRFLRYLYRRPNTIGDLGVATRGLIQIGDKLWVNAETCWLIDLKTGAYEPALTSGTAQQAILYSHQPVASAGGETLWSAQDILARIDPSKKTSTKYPLRGDKNTCWAIRADGRNNLWLGYNEGIGYFDVVQKRSIPFSRYNSWPELAVNRVNGFFPDRQAGGLWVASTSGLYLLDTLRGIVDRYSVEQPAPKNLPFNHITYVHVDPDQPGRYWLATRGGGLIRWDRATGRYKQYTQADGLLNSTVYCLYTDHPDPARRRDKNRLWFTTDYGLVGFDKKTERFQTYLPKDGITHEEFNFTSNYQAPDGRLFLGGLNGVTAFSPNQMQASASINSPMVVTHFQQLDGTNGTMTDYMANYRPKEPIQILPSSRAFSLSFALLDYRFLGQTRLWYRIGGWQEAWATQNQTDLRINGLPPGDYQLDVRMQNINGQWVSGVLTIPVVVHPPFYKRVWFILLCCLAAAGATIALFRWRNRVLVEETVRLESEVANRTAQIKEDKAIIEQQAAELRENATLKSRFFANVTHEFRTPLTLLLGPVTYLAKLHTDATSHRLLSTIERNARHLQELVNDLLGLGKLEVGQLQLDSQPADLRMVVARTVTAFSTQASFAAITLEILGLNQPIGMLLDVPKLETVLRNLIANALRFTPSGGTITVQLDDAPDQVRLSVKDTGRGIHPDDLPHVVERYYQSSRPDAPLQGGTGIGLALCQEYCQLWQGTLTIESVLGKGCLVTFTYPKIAVALPAETAPELLPTAQPPAEPGAAEATANRERLLIVEDNPDMAGYIQLVLAPQYTCHWCRNGLDALTWLTGQTRATLPHLILTDMMMPEMDGMAMLEAIRQQTTLRYIPVIMLTARYNQQVRLQALELGVADYLTKPFDEDELLARVRNLLDRAYERAFWLPSSGDTPVAGEMTAVEPTLGADAAWLQRIQALVVTSLTDSRFQVNDLADAVNMSQRHFYRRLKTLTGLSPIQFVQEVRLQTACEWIEENRYKTVKEVANRVGFQKVSYFSRLYHQRFGISPSLQLNEQSDSLNEATA